MKPLLSVIIPTKNRYIYLKEVLSILVEIERTDIEFVVTDNSSDNAEFSKFIAELNDQRIKYLYVNYNMSQTENSDYALSNSTGDYVCFIGDDDIILEGIFEMVKKMEKEDIDCIIQDPITYYWPDVEFKYSLGSQQPASFIFASDYKYDFVKIDVRKELKAVFESGATRIGLLPRVYHGIVRKQVLDKVRDKCGSYFPGPSPDMASSVALALVSAITVLSKMPFTISGKSGMSASGMGLKHTHVGDLNKDFLPKNVIETWNEKIPKFWSGSTIWAQSALYSLKSMKSDLDINYTALYANLLVFEPHYKKEILAKINIYCTFSDRLDIGFRRFYLFLLRAESFMQRKYFSYNGKNTYHNVSTMKVCYENVNNLLLTGDIKRN